MSGDIKPKPDFFWSMIHLKCPRCRRGDMFAYPNPYSKSGIGHILKIYDHCQVCGQPFDLEPGFWFSTSYVSYGITILISAVTFFTWWLTLGFALDDNRIFIWLAANGVLILALQPVLMRLSRWLVLSFFVRYNENWDSDEVVRLR